MKTLDDLILHRKQMGEVHFRDDVYHIMQAASREGIALTPAEAESIWLWHSIRSDAQWLTVPYKMNSEGWANEIVGVIHEYVQMKAEQ